MEPGFTRVYDLQSLKQLLSGPLRNCLLSLVLPYPAASGFLWGRGPECPLGISLGREGICFNSAPVLCVLLGTKHGCWEAGQYLLTGMLCAPGNQAWLLGAEQVEWRACGGGTEWLSGYCSYNLNPSNQDQCSQQGAKWLGACGSSFVPVSSLSPLSSDSSAPHPQTPAWRGRPSPRGTVRAGW